jgi:Ca2+-binding EF-hand superfamily protein
LTKEHFLTIYASFFPFGDATAFAGHLFRLYDTAGTGSIDFAAFLVGLSVTVRGKLEEKVQWAFRFYDRDDDGSISRTDMLLIIDAIYRMMGGLVEVPPDEDTPTKRVDKLFQQMGKVGN